MKEAVAEFTSMPTTIQALNMSKTYGLGDREGICAVDKASLEIRTGEMVAIVGKPGAGKSTLLHILGCLQRPDSGQLQVEGRDVTKLYDEEMIKLRARKVGFLFQDFNLLPSDTARSNVEVPLRHMGVPSKDRKAKAEEALRVMDLEKCMEHRPGQLSPTQRQCVGIARAMVHDPSIILADEPTRGLDTAAQDYVMGLFQKLNDAGMTIVVTTTDSNTANYCQRIIKIDNGKIKDCGKVSKRCVVRKKRSGSWTWRSVWSTGPARCRRSNANASVSPALWSMIRRSFLRMSPRSYWTPLPRTT
jgi:putative ABC transport system ATP-binding protein